MASFPPCFMAPPDLSDRRLGPDKGGGGEALPDLLKAPPDPSNPGLFPEEGGDVCGSS